MLSVSSEEIERLNAFLDCVDVGNYILRGCFRCFRCKLSNPEKEVAATVNSVIDATMANSPLDATASSPVGNLADASSRRTLVLLICTLNTIFPDYDFRSLRPDQFTKEPSVAACKSYVDSLLLETSRVWNDNFRHQNGNNAGLLETLWQAADDTMQLSECEAYSYSEDRDTSHPATDQPGSLWSFTVFLINKRLNRILCLSCYARAKHASDASYSYSSSEEDYSDMQAENTDASSTLFGIEV